MADIFDKAKRRSIMQSIRGRNSKAELADTNMGGGIPYDTMVQLVAELDEIPVSEIEPHKVK